MIKLLKAKGVGCVMHICHNVRITGGEHVKTMEHLNATGFSPQRLYHSTEQIRLNLCVVTDAQCCEAIYLKPSDTTSNPPLLQTAHAGCIRSSRHQDRLWLGQACSQEPHKSLYQPLMAVSGSELMGRNEYFHVLQSQRPSSDAFPASFDFAA